MNKLERILSNFAGFRSKKPWKQYTACIFYIFALSLCFSGLYGCMLCLLLICGINLIAQLLQLFFSHAKPMSRRFCIFTVLTAFSIAGLFLLPAPTRHPPFSGVSVVSPNASCSPVPTTLPAAVSSNASPSFVPDQETSVYITSSGKKYHKTGCPSLSRSATPIALDKALAQGFTSCKRCNP